MKKSKTLRIIAGTIAIFLILAILFITNAFVGNPISAMMANRAAQRYIEQNYSSLDLELDKAFYNFKDGMYNVRAKSTTSIDTHFSIYYAGGKIQRDDYESYVLEGSNTWQRLSDEYSDLAKKIIAKDLGYENNTTMVTYESEEFRKNFQLDMKFDPSLPVASEVVIRLDLKDHSLEGVEKILGDAHRSFIKNGCYFNKYGLFSDEEDIMVMVDGITPKDIESGQLLALLEEAQKHQDDENYSGKIMVVIREK